MKTKKLPDLTGVNLEGLSLKRRIGVGGMGEVWLGEEHHLEIPVAIKILLPSLAEDQSFVVRFLREARAIARLDHPNIIRVLQAGRKRLRDSDLRVMVMEYVDGGDALELIRESADGLDEDFAAEIVLAAARGLAYAHRKGIVHQDIKPANILVSNDRSVIKVVDFGLAMLDQRDGAITMSDDDAGIIGTPHYLSPEQTHGVLGDPRSDIYSLGITFFHLLTGRLPFEGRNITAVARGHREEDLPLDDVDIKKPYRQLIASLCEKAPSARMTLGNLIEELETLLGDSPPTMMTTRIPIEFSGTNLSKSPNAFLGREHEVERLRGAFIVDGERLVSLLGSAGVGKTRLAQEFGRTNRGRYGGGVWFCDLASANSRDEFCQGVAEGLKLPSLRGDPIEQVHAALRYRRERTLVILDNLEQVIEVAAEALGLWLHNTPMVDFVVTSREAMQIAGERRLDIAPLEMQEGDSGISAAALLFMERAANENPSIDFSSADCVKDVEAVVAALDGIPLAIELAAARSKVLRPEKMLERLTERFDILRSRSRDRGDRHSTLRGAIAWSWELLSDYEQSALAQCAIFEGGFLLDAAEAVIDLSDYPDAPFEIDVIEALCEKNLIQSALATDLVGEFRYRLLETVREFALQEGEVLRVKDLLDIEEWRLRHARFYKAYVEKWSQEKRKGASFEPFNRMNLDAGNVQAASAILAAEFPEEAAELVLTAKDALSQPISSRQCVELINALLERRSELKPMTVILLVAYLVGLTLYRVELESDVSELSFAQEAADAIGAPDASEEATRAHALVHEARGINALQIGNHREAIDEISQALKLVEPLGEDIAFCRTLRALGSAQMIVGQHKEAYAAYERSGVIARRLGDNVALLSTLTRSIGLQMNIGGAEQADKSVDEIERLGRETYNEAALSEVAFHRALLAYHKQEYSKTIEYFEEAESAYKRIGNERNALVAMGNRATALTSLGRNDEALACHREGLAIWRQRKDWKMVCSRLLGISMVLDNMQRHQEAMETLEEAIPMARECGVNTLLAGGLGYLASTVIYEKSYRTSYPWLVRGLACAEESCELHEEMGSLKTRLGFDVVASKAYLHWLMAAHEDCPANQVASHCEAAITMAESATKLGEEIPVAKVEVVDSGKEIKVRMWDWVETVLADKKS